MTKRTCAQFKIAFLLFAVMFFTSYALSPSNALGQSNATVQLEPAVKWKASLLAEIDRQILDNSDNSSDDHSELKLQKEWLTLWSPGQMSATPKRSNELLTVTKEPILKSNISTEVRKRINSHQNGKPYDPAVTDKNSHIAMLESEILKHPNDLALQQLHLHLLDNNPATRKQFLDTVENSAVRLIKSLKEKRDGDEYNLAIEFAMYRRARALAYRELPDVVQRQPIEDSQALDRKIRTAHQDLTSIVGKDRPEFILLEIRMLKRDKKFGSALSLLEKYGSTIQQKWYLKKRRDLLKELGWDFPFSEAAKIYAIKFPEEVAKENRLLQEKQRLEQTPKQKQKKEPKKTLDSQQKDWTKRSKNSTPNQLFPTVSSDDVLLRPQMYLTFQTR